MRKCMKELETLLRAKDPCIYIQTYEEEEFIEELCDMISLSTDKNIKSLNVAKWSKTEGLTTVDINSPNIYNPNAINKELMAIPKFFEHINNNQYQSKTKDVLETIAGVKKSNNSTNTIYVARDLHMYLDNKDVRRMIRDLKESPHTASYCPIIILAPTIEIPCELEKIFTIFEYGLMDKDDILENFGKIFDNDTDILNACVGLTSREIFRALMHSAAKNPNSSKDHKYNIKLKDIMDEKLQIVKKSGALDYIVPQHTLDDLGGNQSFKNYIKEMKISITPQAKEFGISYPKGYMSVGIAGTSKSCSAEILASYLNVPLLSLDLSRIMGSFVGQSERQISNALRIAEACSPCVLLIDEAEKLFGGYQSSNNSDSGTLSRVMAQMLQFTQKDTNVIVVMTSNDVSQLPPEFTRSGRLDTQWYFSLPTEEERAEIANIYLKKSDIVLSDELFTEFIKLTDNFTGAEIKTAVKNILLKSFFRQMHDSQENLGKNFVLSDIQNAVSSVVPLFISNKEKISALENRMKGRVRYASSYKKEDITQSVLSIQKTDKKSVFDGYWGDDNED